MRNLTELFGVPRDLFFVETALLKERLHSRDVTLNIQNVRHRIDLFRPSLHRRRNQMRTWQVQRTLAIPIPLLSGRA
jgi:hypothetical protein